MWAWNQIWSSFLKRCLENMSFCCFISNLDISKLRQKERSGKMSSCSSSLQIMSVQSRSDGVNTSLFEKREHIEKLHRTRNLLRKVQVMKASTLGICTSNIIVMFCFYFTTTFNFATHWGLVSALSGDLRFSFW